MDVAVVAASSGGEEVVLPGAPGQGLDGGLVVGLLELGGVELAGVPDGDEVVVAAGGELSTVRAPLETADFRGVGCELGDLVLGDAHIVVEDKAGAGASREDVLVPAHDADAGVVAVHGAELGLLLDIPDLDLASAEAGGNVCTVARPLDGGDVGVLWAFEEGVHGARLGGPDVDVALEADGDLVARRPVQQVQVVVVDKAWSIQHALRGGQHTAAELRGGGSRWLERAVVLGAEVDRAGGLWRRRLEFKNALLHAHTAGLSDGLLVCHSVRAGLGLRGLILIVLVVVVV